MLDEEGFKGTEWWVPGRAGWHRRRGLCASPARLYAWAVGSESRLVPGSLGTCPSCPRVLCRGCAGLPGRGSPGVAALLRQPLPGRAATGLRCQPEARALPAGRRPLPGCPRAALQALAACHHSRVQFHPVPAPAEAQLQLWQRRAQHRRSQTGRGEPCPAAGSSFWGVLGRFDPFQASPSPGEVPFGDVPTWPGTCGVSPSPPALPGHRPDGLSQRVRSPAAFPRPNLPAEAAVDPWP